MFIERAIADDIWAHFFKRKAIIIVGPRQSGKTTLLQNLVKPYADSVLELNGDDADVRAKLSHTTATALGALLGKKKIVVIDEAQRITGIGLTLKLWVDRFPEIQVLATGSSAFDLTRATDESLTGRKYAYTLLPFSYKELSTYWGTLEESRLLHRRLIYGCYPEMVMVPEEAERHIRDLTSSYLYKDILAIENIKRHTLPEKLLRALAFQCGAEVSYNELAQMIEADPKTVEKYVSILEQAYIIFTLPAFSRNMRNEIRKSRKIYFYDCGVRNAILGNFLSLESRTDVGALWENYCQSERRKKILMENIPSHRGYFWRTKDQREMDYVEESPHSLTAYEFKWNPRRKAVIPRTFTTHYPDAKTAIITPENIATFL